jgi:hypothetical protein
MADSVAVTDPGHRWYQTVDVSETLGCNTGHFHLKSHGMRSSRHCDSVVHVVQEGRYGKIVDHTVDKQTASPGCAFSRVVVDAQGEQTCVDTDGTGIVLASSLADQLVKRQRVVGHHRLEPWENPY